jgi:hypothetical protein
VKKTQSQSLLKQMMGVKEENERIDIMATLDNIERWPVKRKGYAQLASFLLFFTLYCFTMVMQINPGSVFRIDDALRNQVVDEGGALQDVATLGDLFDYLEGQIMENVFPATWYNDDPLTTSESGYVLDYNKLVGGLLIVQRRGLRRKCVEPRYKSMNSSYDDFYRTCYTEQTTESLWPVNETAAKLEAPASLDYKVPWIPGTPIEYDAKNPETIFGKSPTAAPPQQVLDILANNNKLGNFADAFVYDHRYQGFAAFLAYADGATKNLAKLDALKQALWLDKYDPPPPPSLPFFLSSFLPFSLSLFLPPPLSIPSPPLPYLTFKSRQVSSCGRSPRVLTLVAPAHWQIHPRYRHQICSLQRLRQHVHLCGHLLQLCPHWILQGVSARWRHSGCHQDGQHGAV